MRTIPNNGIWTQKNIGDTYGDIYASCNLDLTDNEGQMRLGRRLIKILDNSDAGSLAGSPIGFKSFQGLIWTMAGGYVWKGNASYPSGGFFKDTTTNSPIRSDSFGSDIETDGTYLYTTSGNGGVSTDLHYIDSTLSIWADKQISSSDAGPKMLHYFPYLQRTYCTYAKNKIASWSVPTTVATAGAYTVTIDPSLSITSMRSTTTDIWITTVDTTGKTGYVFRWDGITQSVQQAYKLSSAGALACVIKDDVPYIINTKSELQVFNGGTFKTLSKFWRRKGREPINRLDIFNRRFVHPNSMIVNSLGKINILIDGSSDSGYNGIDTTVYDETIPSGVWEYSEEHGLYHKHSVGINKVSDTITGYGQRRITTISSSTSKIGGMAYIEYTGTAAARNGTILIGSSFITSFAGNTYNYGIFYEDTLDVKQKAGSFITSKYYSQSITEIRNKMYIVYRKLLNSTDRIIVKYRTTEIDPTEMTINWIDTTRFTTTDTNMANYSVGDEVEILSGIGAGKSSHISELVLAGGTYTARVDETYTGATGSAQALLQKWIKLSPVDNQTSEFKELALNTKKVGVWIQFKVFMLFTGSNEIHKMTLINSPHKGNE